MLKPNGKAIAKFLEKTGLNKGEFCKQSGISRYTLNQMLEGKGELAVYQYLKVARFLNVELSEIVCE